MTVYDDKKPLYLETDVCGVEMRAGLLQIRDEMNCLQDVAPEDTILMPVKFTSKSISSAKRVIAT